PRAANSSMRREWSGASLRPTRSMPETVQTIGSLFAASAAIVNRASFPTQRASAHPNSRALPNMVNYLPAFSAPDAPKTFLASAQIGLASAAPRGQERGAGPTD